MAFRFPSQPGGESVVPAQLVLVLVRSRRLPVGRVEAHDSKLAHRRADYALGVVGETGNAVLHGNRLGSPGGGRGARGASNAGSPRLPFCAARGGPRHTPPLPAPPPGRAPRGAAPPPRPPDPAAGARGRPQP